MRHFLRTTTLSAVLVAGGGAAFASGCSSDATSPQQQFPGKYSLSTINGAAPPYAYHQDTTGTYALAADVYTFNSDGSFTEQQTVTYTPESGAAVQQEGFSDTGRWTLTGTVVAINYPSGAESISATFSGGNTITINGSTETGAPLTAVFRK